jgi:hypothetical protein
MRSSFLETEGGRNLCCAVMQNRIHRSTFLLTGRAPPVPAGEATTVMIKRGTESLADQAMLKTVRRSDNGMDNDCLTTADLEKG